MNAKYPWCDITRVGVYGLTGGQNAAGAAPFNPEFYDAGMASSGCHDNRMDKTWWNEQWMGELSPHYAALPTVSQPRRKSDHVATIVLTGGSSGIGEAAAVKLRKAGHQLVITGRSARTAEIARNVGANHFIVDYERLADVRHFADQLLDGYPRIDVLANNAGAIYGPRKVTVDGHEATFQVNHLAGFLLTDLLRERLEASRGVVVNTSSGAHRHGRLDFDDLESERHYNAARAYGTSKLMNILHAIEINKRLNGVRAVSFHPGGVATGFARDAGGVMQWAYKSRLGRLFMISSEAGADTLLWLITDRQWQPGGYHYKRRLGTTSSAVNEENARRLWEVSAALVGRI